MPRTSDILHLIFAGAAANAYCPSVKADFDDFFEANNLVIKWQDLETAISGNHARSNLLEFIY